MEVKILAKQESFQLKSSESFLTLQIIQTAESPNNYLPILTVTGFFDSLTGRCEAPCSACRKYFRHAGGLQKRSEAEQLAPVGVQRYGRARVAMEVKILAKQAGL